MSIRHVVGKELDTGVNRTFVLSLMYGAKESFETLRKLFDSLAWDELLAVLPNAEVVIPVDMKNCNFLLGNRTSSSAYPYAYSLWSPFKKYSQPEILRTVDSVIEQNRLIHEEIS